VSTVSQRKTPEKPAVAVRKNYFAWDLESIGPPF
jgi:hypothetical protein